MGNWGDFTLLIGVITPFITSRGPTLFGNVENQPVGGPAFPAERNAFYMAKYGGLDTGVLFGLVQILSGTNLFGCFQT